MKTPKKPTAPKKRGSGLPDIRPGTAVEIDGLDDPFGGRLFVTPTTHTIGDGGYARRSKAAPVKMKAPKKPAAPKTPPKRGRGRPMKNGHGRKEVSVGLPPDLLTELNAYVQALREETPGASRGDVLSEALRAFRPFRLWKLRRRRS
jgi:hypothetical protein